MSLFGLYSELANDPTCLVTFSCIATVVIVLYFSFYPISWRKKVIIGSLMLILPVLCYCQAVFITPLDYRKFIADKSTEMLRKEVVCSEDGHGRFYCYRREHIQLEN